MVSTVEILGIVYPHGQVTLSGQLHPSFEQIPKGREKGRGKVRVKVHNQQELLFLQLKN